jgi:predicted aldo/keto reductase-like oxidoreductase
MNYRSDRRGNPISILGYGCMRFPQSMGRIDMPQTEQLILSAVRSGINYFDTAYIYPGSEAALGEILAKHGLREQINIATKLPHYLIRSRAGLEKLFQEQLRRLRTDYIDYYLMHMLTDIHAWDTLRELGIEDWLAEKKASGAIRQVGFSYHGNSEMFCHLVDAYDWDFTMIQYNYMDEHSQAGRRGLNHAHEKGLPVFIMEPLRGGKLVNNLPAQAEQIFSAHSVSLSPAQWALRWLWDQSEVTCVLSGMGSEAMLTDNLQTAESSHPGILTEDDQQMLHRVADAINAKMKVGCTGCGYCMPCPVGVDIPGCFAAYNRRFTEGKWDGFREYMMCTALRKTSTAASNCIGCGKCETHCPQSISIRSELANVKKTLEGPLYKTIRAGVRLFDLF